MKTRLGLHYYNDTHHFQEKDLALWLPQMLGKHISWLVLQSSLDFAIPEDFIKSLLSHNIEPVIQFSKVDINPGNAEEARIILRSYARWGVKYVIFFDKPNLRRSWDEGLWNKGDIVDRFLDVYISYVKMASREGLTSVFPPLQPGGDYWDTAFIKKVLKSAMNRKCIEIISNLHIAISGQTFNKPLHWGLGEQNNSLNSTAYAISKDMEDHIGFRTSDWYTKMVEPIIGYQPKVLMFWFGSRTYQEPETRSEQLNDLVSLALDQGISNNIHPISKNVISCIFDPLSTVANLNIPELVSKDEMLGKVMNKDLPIESLFEQDPFDHIAKNVASWVYPIDHYLLLPKFDWGIPEHILEKIRPIMKSEQPTIGFSLDEAALARKVTVWNENHAFSEGQLEYLKNSGCLIDEKIVSGIEVALEV